jgi:hypothetical protein
MTAMVTDIGPGVSSGLLLRGPDDLRFARLGFGSHC